MSSAITMAKKAYDEIEKAGNPTKSDWERMLAAQVAVAYATLALTEAALNSNVQLEDISSKLDYINSTLTSIADKEE